MPILFTYDNGNRLEDVMRQVVQITPTETPFMSGIGKTQANNTLHQWPEVTLTTRSDNAVAEGAAFGAATSRILTAASTSLKSLRRCTQSVRPSVGLSPPVWMTSWHFSALPR